MIPLLDLKALNAPMQAEIEEAVLRVTRSGRFILGPEVEAFEAEWAAYCGAKHCVGTGNALDALRLSLMALDLGPGCEVIVASNTYIATWLAVSLVGAVPVPVEPDPSTFNLDPARIAAAVTPRTVAILPTHLYGRCADMDAINEAAVRYGLHVLADAAQAHGAMYKGRKAGSLCRAEAFSFYPSKNLGALGDGGAVTTDDPDLADRIRRLRNYGGVGRLDHRVRGINSRLDELQAAVLRVKLRYLDAMNTGRRARADAYAAELYRTALVLPDLHAGSVFHQYVIRSERREELVAFLGAAGIEAHIHYPVPPHLEGAYADLGYGPGSFPIAERLAREIVSLPIGNDVDVPAVAGAVRLGAGMLRQRAA